MRLIAGNSPTDDQTLDIVGPLIDLADAHITVDALDGKVAGPAALLLPPDPPS